MLLQDGVVIQRNVPVGPAASPPLCRTRAAAMIENLRTLLIP